MSNEKTNTIPPGVFEVSLECWEKLARSLDHAALTEVVKHDAHLQRNDFKGFRPTHLPWERAPLAIAKHAVGCPATQKFLLEAWQKEPNIALYQRVQAEITPSEPEEGLARLLASLGGAQKERDRLLWALILDERPAMREALANGIYAALTDETSSLSVKAEVYLRREKQQQLEQDLANIRSERDGLRVQITHMLQQFSSNERKQAQADQPERKTLADVQWENERLLAELEQARSHNRVLQKNVEELDGRLQVTQTEFKQQLVEVRSENAKLVQENAELRCSVQEKVEESQRLIVAFEQGQNEQKSRTEQLDAAKKLIDAKDQLLGQYHEEKEYIQEQLLRVEKELGEVRQLLADKEREHASGRLALRLEDAWQEARNSLSRYFVLLLTSKKPAWQEVTLTDKWADWQHWQEIETELVGPLFMEYPSVSALKLADAESIQKLLVLRWYLLEWVKSSMLEKLRTGNYVMQTFSEERYA